MAKKKAPASTQPTEPVSKTAGELVPTSPALDVATPGNEETVASVLTIAASSSNGTLTARILKPIEIVSSAFTDSKIPHKIYKNSVYKDNGLAWGINFGDGSVIEIDHGGNIEGIRYSYLSFDAEGNFKRNI